MTGELLQDAFLRRLCKQRALISVYLVSGIQLQGRITAFDADSVLLKNTTEQMIFKHAIASVVGTTGVVGPPNPEEIEPGCLEEG